MKTKERIGTIIVTFATLFSLGCIGACCGGAGSRQTKNEQVNLPDQKEKDGATSSTPDKAQANAAAEKPGKQKEAATKPAKTAGSSQDYADEATIRDATIRRNEALAQQEQVRARNADKYRQYSIEIEAWRMAEKEHEAKLKALKAEYEEALKAFKKAKIEYSSLKTLDFAKKFDKEFALAKWYQDIIRDYPGTDAAKEAQSRMAGNAPKQLPVPPEPVEPKRAAAPKSPVEPNRPNYEDEPAIPTVPTIDELRAEKGKTLPYEVLKNFKRPDGKFVMDVLVSEAASQQEVMKLAEDLKRKYAGQYATISIFDSREAQRRRTDMAYPEKELSRHWLVVIDWGGDTGRAERISWVAEGRDH